MFAIMRCQDGTIHQQQDGTCSIIDRITRNTSISSALPRTLIIGNASLSVQEWAAIKYCGGWNGSWNQGWNRGSGRKFEITRHGTDELNDGLFALIQRFGIMQGFCYVFASQSVLAFQNIRLISYVISDSEAITSPCFDLASCWTDIRNEAVAAKGLHGCE
jgi:hypothetical protein